MAEPGDSYNRGGFIAFAFSMAFSLLFFVYVSFLHPGVDLKEIPEAAAPEQMQAQAPTSAVDVKSIPDPWKENPALVEHGQQVYTTNCAVCHGPTGAGDGPAGASLNPPPRNFVEGKWTQGGSSIDLFKTLQTGVPGTSMVSFSHLPVVDRWALVQYIRSITKNKVPDDPAKLEAFGKSAQ